MAPVEPFEAGVVGLLFGGAALCLTTFAYTHCGSTGRSPGGGSARAPACLVLLPLAPRIPALAALVTLLAVVVGVNVLDELILHRRPEASGGRATADQTRGHPGQVDQGPVVDDR